MSISTATRTQRLTLIAILSAISFSLMIFPQFPIVPGADFLRVDFSIVPVMIALYWLGLSAAISTIVIRTILKLVLANEGVNTYLGLPVNIVAMLSFIIVIFIMMPRFQETSMVRQAIAIVVSTIILAFVGIMMNLFIAVPLYAQFANFDIPKYIGLWRYLVAMVLPFNLIQGVIWGAVSMMVLTMIKPLHRRFNS